MGMYTELVLACSINRATDQQIKVLHDMVNRNAEFYGDEFEAEDHPLFKTDRWKRMLYSGSYYFPGDPHSFFRWDEISKEYMLTVRCNLKNYSSEIEHFCDWVSKLSNDIGFVGYKRYEEQENPTLIYFDHGCVEYK